MRGFVNVIIALFLACMLSTCGTKKSLLFFDQDASRPYGSSYLAVDKSLTKEKLKRYLGNSIWLQKGMYMIEKGDSIFKASYTHSIENSIKTIIIDEIGYNVYRFAPCDAPLPCLAWVGDSVWVVGLADIVSPIPQEVLVDAKYSVGYDEKDGHLRLITNTSLMGIDYEIDVLRVTDNYLFLRYMEYSPGYIRQGISKDPFGKLWVLFKTSEPADSIVSLVPKWKKRQSKD